MQTAAKDTVTSSDGNRKRKSTVMIEPEDLKKKKKKTKSSHTGPPSTPTPHGALLEELSPKYDVLPAFTISSTKIHRRVEWLLLHLRKNNGDARKRVVLLYARPGEVGKMITISEQVKRIVAEEEEESGGGGGQWYQYNKMYELPPKPEIVEETVLAGADGNEYSDDDDNDDAFEIMESRFQQATVPQPTKRTQMSLSIFLSLVPIPELKAKEGVTQQTNELQGAAAATPPTDA